MIAHFGCRDSSGDKSNSIDLGLCNCCGAFSRLCPAGALEMAEDAYYPLDTRKVTVVSAAEARYARDRWAPRRAHLEATRLPCLMSCPANAVSHSS